MPKRLISFSISHLFPQFTFIIIYFGTAVYHIKSIRLRFLHVKRMILTKVAEFIYKIYI